MLSVEPLDSSVRAGHDEVMSGDTESQRSNSLLHSS